METENLSIRKPLLSVNEVANVLGISAQTLAKTLIKSGTLPSVKIGRFVRITADALETYIQSSARARVRQSEVEGGAA